MPGVERSARIACLLQELQKRIGLPPALHACGRKNMKALFWIGLGLLVLGIASFFVPLPHKDREGFKAGPVSVGIETERQETVSPVVSALIVLAAAGLMIAGGRKSS